MKVKAIAKELKNAEVRFISLVKRGANRIPFRILKHSDEESKMIDLSKICFVQKTDSMPEMRETHEKSAYLPNFAQILAGGTSRDIGTPQPPIVQAPAYVAKPLPTPAKTTPASVGKPLTRAFNKPKQPASSSASTNTGNSAHGSASANAHGMDEIEQLRAQLHAQLEALRQQQQQGRQEHQEKEAATLRAVIDTALEERFQREQAERFNAKRSAFSRITPTQKHHVEGGGNREWFMHNLKNMLLSAANPASNGTARKSASPLPSNSALRAMSGASLNG